MNRLMIPTGHWLFDDFFRGWGTDLTPWRSVGEVVKAYSPKVDVTDSEREVRVTAELPGMEEKDVEVSFSGDVLTIQGEKRAEHEEKGQQVYRLERSYGAFCRTIPLPAPVEEGKVSASFKNGVLTVTLPKTAEAQQKAARIPVRGE